GPAVQGRHEHAPPDRRRGERLLAHRAQQQGRQAHRRPGFASPRIARAEPLRPQRQDPRRAPPPPRRRPRPHPLRPRRLPRLENPLTYAYEKDLSPTNARRGTRGPPPDVRRPTPS